MPTCRSCPKPARWLADLRIGGWECGDCRAERQVRERAQQEQRREEKAARDAAKRAAQAARKQLTDDAPRAAAGEIDLDDYAQALTALQLNDRDRRRLIADGYQTAIERALDDSTLTTTEEQALNAYRKRFNVVANDLRDRNMYDRVAQAAVLRDVADGVDLQRFETRLSGGHPFNLMKSETMVWRQDDVRYYKVKTQRQFRGSSHGLSLRVTKGVYYRPGVFSGRSVSSEEDVHVDTGLIGLTTKHIYFHGERERFRVRFSRIVSFEAYDDGFGIMRDNQRAKPETFRTGDGWFINNLVAMLAADAE